MATLSTLPPEKSAARAGLTRRIPPVPVVAATAGYNRYKVRKRLSLPVQTPGPRSIAWTAVLVPGIAPAATARAHLLPASPASGAAIPAPAPAAAFGTRRILAYARKLPARASAPVAVRCTARVSFRPDASSFLPVFRSRGSSRRQRRVAFQRLPQFVPRAEQHHAHKGAPHSQRIRNFVVAHVRVIAHHQRHARPAAQFVQRFAHFFAGALLDQLIQLAGVGMLQRHIFQIVRFFILANLATPRRIPAMIR